MFDFFYSVKDNCENNHTYILYTYILYIYIYMLMFSILYAVCNFVLFCCNINSLSGQLWNSIFKLLLFFDSKGGCFSAVCLQNSNLLSIIKWVLMKSVVTFGKWASTISEIIKSSWNPQESCYKSLFRILRHNQKTLIMFHSLLPHPQKSAVLQTKSPISKESAIVLVQLVFLAF